MVIFLRRFEFKTVFFDYFKIFDAMFIDFITIIIIFVVVSDIIFITVWWARVAEDEESRGMDRNLEEWSEFVILNCKDGQLIYLPRQLNSF